MERLIPKIQKHYGLTDLDHHDPVLIRTGNYCNANVYRLTRGNCDIVIKEFHSRAWFFRVTIGRFLISREFKALSTLNSVPWIPKQVARLTPYCLAMEFVQGETLKQISKRKQRNLETSFFIELENSVKELHQKNLVHLDIRNRGNIICTDDNHPFIIDFQSALNTRFMPAFLRKTLEKTDYSGIYKCWNKLGADSLDPQRQAFMDEFKQLRRLWIFKGYPLKKLFRKKRRNKARTAASPTRDSLL